MGLPDKIDASNKFGLALLKKVTEQQKLVSK
jgi:hypothetical protein